MALDFTVLKDDGTPGRTAPMGAEQHHQIMVAASALELTNFKRFSDYYSDEEITLSDLQDLSDEVDVLLLQPALRQSQGFLEDLKALIAVAIEEGKAVHVIAD